MTAERPVPRAYRPAPPRRDVAPDAEDGLARGRGHRVRLRPRSRDRGSGSPTRLEWPVGVAIVVIPLLLLVTAPLFVRAARTETALRSRGAAGHRSLAAVRGQLLTGSVTPRDASVYHRVGSNLAQSFRHFDFAVDLKGSMPGTGGMNFVSGVAEVVTNGNEFATFLLFSWLGFIGCFLLYRAFVIALPDADHRRYALLIFLWPTMLFWPSSIGKDCWMIFTLGIGALGAARVLVRRPGGYSLLVVGTLLGSLVRPHVVLLELVAFGARVPHRPST